MESLSDPSLCLQDLVTGVTTSSSNSVDLHGVHHHLHDSVSSAVSVSSSIPGIMSGSALGHHITSHDPHHHGVVPHTPSLHPEPLEKLKQRGEFDTWRPPSGAVHTCFCMYYVCSWVLHIHCVHILTFTIAISVSWRDRATDKWKLFCRIQYSEQISLQIHCDICSIEIFWKKQN